MTGANRSENGQEPSSLGREPQLVLDQITRSFSGQDRPAVDSVSLTVERGDFVAVIGPSGSGKSTLLNILGLLDRPSSGRYLLDGKDVTQLRGSELDGLRSHLFGFVFQSSHVLGDESPVSNAAMGLRVQGVPRRSRALRAVRALAQVGLGHRLNTAAKLLSGGERQRLAIARATATRPGIILADEPTGNLDSENSRHVMAQLRRLNAQGVTVVIITHDPEVALSARRRIRILDGLLSEETVDDPLESAPRQDPPETASGSSSQGAKVPPGLPQSGGSTAAAPWWRSLGDDLSEALSALATRASRTVLLILAFALGIGGLIASVGLSSSASAAVSGRLTAAALDEVRATVPYASLGLRDGDAERQVSTVTGLQHVVDVGYLGTTSASESRITRLSPAAMEPDVPLSVAVASPGIFRIGDMKLLPEQASGLLSSSVSKQTGPAAVLSLNAARALSVLEPDSTLRAPASGHSIWVNGLNVPVAGVFEPGERFPELLNSVVLNPPAATGLEKLNLTLVIKTEPGFPAAVAKSVPLALSPAQPGSVATQTVADLQNLRLGVTSDLSVLVGVLSAVLLALATVSASATMYLTVQARVTEIALRRAIGASKAMVARLFLLEGVLIGTAGGIVGVALGQLGALVTASVQGWPAILPPALPWLALGLGALTGLLSALYPALAASRRDPALALRG